MPTRCPTCMYDDPYNNQSLYCVRCGNPLFLGQNPTPTSSPGAQVLSATPGTTNPQMHQWQSPPATPQVGVSQYGSISPASGIGSLRRAFAGHGVLVKHHSWLLKGEGAKCETVRSTLMDKIKQRNQGNLHLHMDAVNLTDQSLQEERRDYIKVERKVSTVFIYVTPAGLDLYLSRATTVKPALSLFRVIVLILILAIIVVPILNIASASAEIPQEGLGAIGSLILWVLLAFFFSFPFMWILTFLLARSLVYFIKDGDFLTLLRPAELTEFQRDDVALLEHETDDIVRDAIKQLGLDADQITPPVTGYEPAKRIRLI